MDLSHQVGVILNSNQSVRDLLAQQRLVVCFGQRATLCFAIAGPLRDCQVVGACTSASEALACIRAQQPDFLLCGDQLETGCGINLAITVKQQWPTLRTLVLISGRPATASLKAAIDAGCDGMLLDSSLGAGTASAAVATVCGGGVVIDRRLIERLRANANSAGPGPIQALSSRERDVLTRLVHGDNNAEIAAELVITIDTVKSHIKNLLLKLNARSRTQAAVQALQLGLVDWPSDPEDR
ncbi:MAG: response regulator transcription factor [Cyanobacteriota bacterium]|nr:response regulator transcription factor [Cyanobacteriota bacterium]